MAAKKEFPFAWYFFICVAIVVILGIASNFIPDY